MPVVLEVEEVRRQDHISILYVTFVVWGGIDGFVIVNLISGTIDH